MIRWSTVVLVMLAACGDDAAKPTDAPERIDAAIDASVDAPELVTHDCATADYVVRTGAADERLVTFPGMAFQPKCMTIAAGQSVTFTGDFAIHPVTPGLSPTHSDDPPPSPNNPIPMTQTGATMTAGPFTAAGTFPYYCSTHSALGMLGVIKVVP